MCSSCNGQSLVISVHRQAEFCYILDSNGSWLFFIYIYLCVAASELCVESTYLARPGKSHRFYTKLPSEHYFTHLHSKISFLCSDQTTRAYLRLGDLEYPSMQNKHSAGPVFSSFMYRDTWNESNSCRYWCTFGAYCSPRANPLRGYSEQTDKAHVRVIADYQQHILMIVLIMAQLYRAEREHFQKYYRHWHKTTEAVWWADCIALCFGRILLASVGRKHGHDPLCGV